MDILSKNNRAYLQKKIEEYVPYISEGFSKSSVHHVFQIY